MEKSKQVLIIALLNNNHLSNVRTLQSIYKQSYSNIVLAVCNDAASAFQSERFFYNLTVTRPQGIRKVFFLENRHPKGDVATVSDVLRRFPAAYVIVVHSGDLFCSPETVETVVNAFENAPQADVLSAFSEKWSDDFSTKLQTLSLPSANEDLRNLKDPLSSAWKDLQDCMLVYRGELLHQTLLSATHRRTVIQTALADMILRGCRITEASVPVCKHSNDTLFNPTVEEPSSLSSKTDPSASRQAAEGSSVPPSAAPSCPIKELPAMTPSQSTRHRRNKLLFHLSTSKKNIAYMILTLLLINCSLLCFLIHTRIAIIFGAMFSVLAFLACLWSVCMIGFHIYFKIKPERLIANDV